MFFFKVKALIEFRKGNISWKNQKNFNKKTDNLNKPFQ